MVILVSAAIWQVFLKGKPTKTGNDVNQLKITLKNSWNHIEWTYFWRLLVIWNRCSKVLRSFCLEEMQPQLNFPVTLYCFEYRSATILLENNKPTPSYSLMTFQAFLYKYLSTSRLGSSIWITLLLFRPKWPKDNMRIFLGHN